MSLSIHLLWHLEVSFTKSGMNCFQSDTSKAAFSISLACLTVTQLQHEQGWMSKACAVPLNGPRMTKTWETVTPERHLLVCVLMWLIER